MTETRPKVLVVDDDLTVSEVVARYLEREGYDVSCCDDGAVGLARALAESPDLVILDLMLPGLDGLEVFRRLRAASPVSVIMLTAKGDEGDRIAGLELGADDYVAKPFSARELVLRVKSVLRRGTGASAPATADDAPMTTGALALDPRAREATLDGDPVALTVREFDLLAYLMRHPRQAFTREQLLETVWGYTFGDTSTVTVHVRRLRTKIEPDPAEPTFISTVWGVGYRFEGHVDE